MNGQAANGSHTGPIDCQWLHRLMINSALNWQIKTDRHRLSIYRLGKRAKCSVSWLNLTKRYSNETEFIAKLKKKTQTKRSDTKVRWRSRARTNLREIVTVVSGNFDKVSFLLSYFITIIIISVISGNCCCMNYNLRYIASARWGVKVRRGRGERGEGREMAEWRSPTSTRRGLDDGQPRASNS